jgi:UDP-N-acetylglucosamine 2-epimerase (non-hydrolysing)
LPAGAGKVPRYCIILLPYRNPIVRESLKALLGDQPRVFLPEPFDYDQLVVTKSSFTLLFFHSGGLQEEAPALGKLVLVLRRTTERPEELDAGTP